MSKKAKERNRSSLETPKPGPVEGWRNRIWQETKLEKYSTRKSLRAGKMRCRTSGHAKFTKAVQAARKAFGMNGFQAVEGKSVKGQALWKKARGICRKVLASWNTPNFVSLTDKSRTWVFGGVQRPPSSAPAQSSSALSMAMLLMISKYPPQT